MEEGMVIRRTTLAALFAGLFLFALFVGSCKDSESPSSPTAPGTATVMGTVVSGDAATSGSALSGVTVSAVSSGQAAVTDAGGNFMLPGVSSGSQTLQFSRGDIDGRGTLAVVGGATMAVDVRISNRSTVVITPRGNPNAPAQTVTPGGCKTEEQIEGIVVSNIGGTLTIFDQRLGTVMVIASPTTVIRKGQTPVAFADIVVGWRVHVKGCLQSPGLYLASEIIVQDTSLTSTPGAPTNSPTVTNTRTNSPTVTITPTITNTSGVSVTSTSTNTPTVTNTPTSTPTIGTGGH